MPLKACDEKKKQTFCRKIQYLVIESDMHSHKTKLSVYRSNFWQLLANNQLMQNVGIM